MYAVIDIGSNTMRLVLYRFENGQLSQILSSKEPAGLAGYLDKARRLTPQGVSRAVGALKKFQAVLQSIQPEETYVFATASLRNITNTREVLDALRAETGFAVEVLSGEQEARLDYAGALRDITAERGLLVDIGGGSTELAVFDGGEALAACSLPMGSLNMYTGFVREVIPTGKELKAIRRSAEELLDTAELEKLVPAGGMVCGVGGTCRAVCALYDQLYDEKLGYQARPGKTVRQMRRMLRQDRPRMLSAMIKAAPDRVHTLLPGLVILETVIRRYGCTEFAASPYGVREGYLLHRLSGGACGFTQV